MHLLSHFDMHLLSHFHTFNAILMNKSVYFMVVYITRIYISDVNLSCAFLWKTCYYKGLWVFKWVLCQVLLLCKSVGLLVFCHLLDTANNNIGCLNNQWMSFLCRSTLESLNCHEKKSFNYSILLVKIRDVATSHLVIIISISISFFKFSPVNHGKTELDSALWCLYVCFLNWNKRFGCLYVLYIIICWCWRTLFLTVTVDSLTKEVFLSLRKLLCWHDQRPGCIKRPFKRWKLYIKPIFFLCNNMTLQIYPNGLCHCITVKNFGWSLKLILHLSVLIFIVF